MRRITKLGLIAFSVMAIGTLVSAADMRTVSVSGNATVEVVPDRARISVGVVARHLDPQVAMNELSGKVAGMIEALEAAGIEEQNMQTSNLSLQPNWEKGKANGFIAQNVLSIETGSIEELPALIGALAKAGMNDLGGLQFFSSQQETLTDQAMIAAVDDAKATAQALADAVGMELGDPITVNYGANTRQPQPMMRAAMAMEMADVAIAEGSVGVDANVSITYELLPN